MWSLDRTNRVVAIVDEKNDLSLLLVSKANKCNQVHALKTHLKTHSGEKATLDEKIISASSSADDLFLKQTSKQMQPM